jgi:predicted dienelactone hydrolase
MCMSCHPGTPPAVEQPAAALTRSTGRASGPQAPRSPATRRWPRLLASLVALALLAMSAPAIASRAGNAATGAPTRPPAGQAGLAGAAGLPTLRLPAPTGPHHVGTTSLHLVDRQRTDPLAPTPRPRELMVQLWYPAAHTSRHALAPYLPDGVSSALISTINASAGTRFPEDVLTFPTNSRRGAPAASGRRPVLLLSPGFGTNAAFYTTFAEELASRGYVVAGIDHTFDTTVVEFPDGRLETQPDGTEPSPLLFETRVADARFVLDQLMAFAAGRNPDVDRAPQPHGLGRALDLDRVGMFGHSFGNPTSAQAMLTDRRIDAGAGLDGSLFGSVVQDGLDRPYLLMGNVTHRRGVDQEGWAELFEHLRAERHWLIVTGTGHLDFSDFAAFKEQVDLSAVFPDAGVDGSNSLGPIDGARALTVVRRYLAVWFDHTLRGQSEPLLRGPSRRFPEVEIQ